MFYTHISSRGANYLSESRITRRRRVWVGKVFLFEKTDYTGLRGEERFGRGYRKILA
ncbi:hypothetical protein JT359_03340 [Candidatus Poribacteria bacterium]|nr:hypothetical protein [Candidatus Poribacteria bacterium]